MSRTATALQTPADLIAYQRELVRTGKYIPLGRMNKIAIGPSDAWPGPMGDPYMMRYGRLIDLRDRLLPIAQAGSEVLVTAPMVMPDGRVGLPDVPQPDWDPPAWTEEEITRKVIRPAEKSTPPTLEQRLSDRCEWYQGQPGVLEGTNFFVFQPVLNVAFQPEIKNRLSGRVWIIEFFPLNGIHAAFLVDRSTGECFFHGGRYDIHGAPSESTAGATP
jgi:hypothetical protein